MKYYYATFARIPGRKAHSSQIAQMCRAFLNAGVDLELVKARRYPKPIFKNKTIADWYGFESAVPATDMPCVDALARLPRWAPRMVYKAAFSLMVSTYNRSLVDYLSGKGDDYVLYSRDLRVLKKINKEYPGVRKIAELHMLSSKNSAALKEEIETLSSCDGVVVVTSPMKELLQEHGMDGDKIIVEHNSVDLRAFPGTASKQEARTALNLPLDARIVMYIGNFHTTGIGRDLETIADAIPSVVQRHDNALFLFVGGPMQYAEPLREKMRHNGTHERHYRFIDRQPYDKIHLWLAAADALVNLLPHNRMFDMVTTTLKEFEYMTSGRPMVVSELPAKREVLFNEVNALVVPPSDPQAFSGAIKKLFAQPALAERIAEKAKEDVRAMTWDARAKRIIRWIEGIR